MSFYGESLARNLRERVAHFKSAGFAKEAELLQARLKAIESKPSETLAATASQASFQNPAAEIIGENLRAKLSAETSRFPELEKQYILERLGKAKTLNELKPLQIAYIERLMKISRAASNNNIELNPAKEETAGPYNNEKIFCEALRIIYSQDPLWIEDLKELYFSVMPKCFNTAGPL